MAQPLRETTGMATLVGIFIEYLFIRFHDFKSISNDDYLLEADVCIISIMTGFTLTWVNPPPPLFVSLA